jgi:alkanesulfonate monooxygenase SsuD/methylene tetrahydromethanopterin reductase-like flavin-dependent oxidoreductase (luciferase family)
VASATDRITVLTNVLGVPYRAPAVTAKMAETLDRLSGGRLVLGLGVGGFDEEFAAFGLARRTPGEKVAALDEWCGSAMAAATATTAVQRHRRCRASRSTPRRPR